MVSVFQAPVADGSDTTPGSVEGPIRLLTRILAPLPGLCAILAITPVAAVAGRMASVVGAPIVALMLGVASRSVIDLVAARRRGPAAGRADKVATDPGSRLAGRYLLQAAIVLLGAGLSAGAVLRAGLASLPVMLGTLTLCLVGAWLLGRLLAVPQPLRTLLGVGTGICGASAIAAVSPVLAATEAETTYAVTTIMVYNVVAAVVFPPIGHLLGLDPHAFGLWVGTAVNDTSSVVATGFAYGAEAGRYAVTVKLTRVLALIPVVLGLVVLRRRQIGASASRPPLWRLLPPFIVLFAAAVLANSAGLVPSTWHGVLNFVAGLSITAALAGVGLGTRLRSLRHTGLRPLLLGGLLSVLVATSGVALQLLAR